MDNVFNYQLTIQKLEEELKLYRNGTTGAELLELINEKDAIIKSLNEDLEEKNGLIQKLAKSSAEVLERCQIITADNGVLQSDKSLLEKQVEQCSAQLQQLQQQLETSRDQKAELQGELQKMSEELTERFDDITKLQTRCATLVAEKNAKARQAESEAAVLHKRIKEVGDECSKLKATNDSLRNQLLAAQAQAEQSTKKHQQVTLEYGEFQSMVQQRSETTTKQIEDLNLAQRALTKECEGRKADLKAALLKVETLSKQNTELSETMAVIAAGKDGQIGELVQRMRALEREIEQRDAAALKEVSVPPLGGAPATKGAAAGTSGKAVPPATQQARGQNHSPVRHINGGGGGTVHAAKSADLETKIRRQEEYLRARFLRDKTNAIVK